MKKWMIASIVFALLASMVSVASADPGNGTNAYTLDVVCGDESFTIQIMNDHAAASFRLDDSHGNVGVLKEISVEDDGGNLIFFYSVPGDGVYKRTETCTWREGGYNITAKVLIPHE